MRPLPGTLLAFMILCSCPALRAQSGAVPTGEDREAKRERRRAEAHESLRKKSFWVERAGLSRSVLQEGSDQGMSWSDEAVLHLGAIIEEASEAVRKLHDGNPSLSASAGGGGTSANIEDVIRAVTFTTGDDDKFARGCKSHQLTTFYAVKGMGSGNDRESPLEIHRIRVQRKGFTHNAVIVFPNGKDWRKNGIILDGWVRQDHLPDRMTFLFRDWYGKLDFYVRLLPDEDAEPAPAPAPERGAGLRGGSF